MRIAELTPIDIALEGEFVRTAVPVQAKSSLSVARPVVVGLVLDVVFGAADEPEGVGAPGPAMML